MQLHYAAASPFVRKVMVVLHETGQRDDVTLVPASVGPLTSGDPTLSHNPLGKIPTLTRPDGPALYDSRVICRYLDARGGSKLYPESRIWEVLTLEATADGIMEAALLMVYEGRLRDEGQRSQAWVDAQWTKIDRTLGVIEQRWMSHLGGPTDICQIAIGCALGYLDFRHGDRGWRTGHQVLADWFDAYRETPAMQQTAPQG